MNVAEFHHDRVRRLTPAVINQKIDLETHHHIQETISKGPKALKKRLAELDAEWDIDRVLMASFSGIVLPQLLAARKNPNRLWLPLVQTSFLLMHATLGWCPPMLLLRPLGFRTKREIQSEKDALLFAQRNHEVSQLNFPE